LFVEIRKRLGLETINAINEKIVSLKTRMESSVKKETAVVESGSTIKKIKKALRVKKY
jgi:hypothetical protein